AAALEIRHLDVVDAYTPGGEVAAPLLQTQQQGGHDLRHQELEREDPRDEDDDHQEHRGHVPALPYNGLASNLATAWATPHMAMRRSAVDVSPVLVPPAEIDSP